MLRPSMGQASWKISDPQAPKILHGYRRAFITQSLLIVVLQALQLRQLPGKGVPWAALDDNSAISAIGYDLFMAMGGLVIFCM